MQFVQFTSAYTGEPVLVNLDRITQISPCDDETTWLFEPATNSHDDPPAIKIRHTYKDVYALIVILQRKGG